MVFNLFNSLPTPNLTAARPALTGGALTNVRPISTYNAAQPTVNKPTYSIATSNPATSYTYANTGVQPGVTANPIRPTYSAPVSSPGITLPQLPLPALPAGFGAAPPAWHPETGITPASTAAPSVNNPALANAITTSGANGGWTPPTGPFFDPMGGSITSSTAQTPPNALPPALTNVTPQTPGYTPQQNMPSLEQLALNGGGASNKQQISNFMTALNGIGAGSNNAQLAQPVQAQAPVQNLINPGVVNQNNGSAGTLSSTAGSYSPVQQPTTTPGGAGAGLSVPTNVLATLNKDLAGGTNNNSSVPNWFNQLTNAASAPFQDLISDQNLKTNIQPADKQLNNFMQSIKAHSYQYKDPKMAGAGFGTYVSPMAQELEKTELGKQAVIDTPQGKMVNYGRLTGVNLAAVSVVHREQQRLQDQVSQLRKQVNILKRSK